jgi:hypothetical protein
MWIMERLAPSPGLPEPPAAGMSRGVETIMRRILVAFVLVAGCGGSGPASNQASPPVAQRSPDPSPAEPAPPPEREPSLAGLWEGGAAAHRDQLCLVVKGSKTQFGVVVWGSNLASCSGAGEATRRGDALILRMTGDSACTIEATAADGRIVFRRAAGPGCADYYCGHSARFDGAAFSRTGTGAAAARKATDIAGDPLCG